MGLPENEFEPAPARPLRWPKCDLEQVIELLQTDLVRLMEIVIECDFNTENHSELFRYITEAKLEIQDVWTTVLAHLSAKHKAPLAMAVNSGSKSIHGWFPVGGASRRVQTHFFRDACLLGADPQMVNTNQWTRFPNGIRTSNGTRQKVEYFNPDTFLLNF